MPSSVTAQATCATTPPVDCPRMECQKSNKIGSLGRAGRQESTAVEQLAIHGRHAFGHCKIGEVSCVRAKALVRSADQS